MKRVIIMRGLPGSGKSTEAKKYNGAFIVSADDYFMINGEYRFDPTKLGNAHIECMRKFIHAVGAGEPVVVVDNTNIRVSELSPYRLVALAYDYSVEIVRVECPIPDAIRRNIHGVPEKSIMYMAGAFENLPPFFEREQIVITA